MAKTVRTSGAYTLQPTTEVVTLKNGLLFTPVAFANLPSTPAMGMVVAFLTTDGAGSTKNKLCYYETANNRWNYVDDNSAVATS